MSGVHPGWEEDVNAFGYGSGGGLLAAIISGGVIGSFGGPFGTLAGGFIAGLAYGLLEHTAMWKDPAVWDIIEGVIPD